VIRVIRTATHAARTVILVKTIAIAVIAMTIIASWQMSNNAATSRRARSQTAGAGHRRHHRGLRRRSRCHPILISHTILFLALKVIYSKIMGSRFNSPKDACRSTCLQGRRRLMVDFFLQREVSKVTIEERGWQAGQFNQFTRHMEIITILRRSHSSRPLKRD
jgi:hypothetical protein